MDLSIIIVAWNSSREILDCLNSLKHDESSCRVETEIIVVDNASSDGTGQAVRDAFPETRVIFNEENHGFARASNQGIDAAGGRYMLLLNPDCIVRAGVIAGIVEFMDTTPDAGVCGCMLLESDGSLQYSCRRFPRPTDVIFSLPFLSRLLPANPYQREYLMMNWEHDGIRQVDWLSGACLAMRREAIDEIGLLDEDYFMYCEDMDWCYRLSGTRWKAFYLPHLEVVHHRGSSSNLVPERMLIAHHVSMWKYARKHLRGKWPGPLFTLLATLVLALRVLPLLLMRLGAKIVKKTHDERPIHET